MISSTRSSTWWSSVSEPSPRHVHPSCPAPSGGLACRPTVISPAQLAASAALGAFIGYVTNAIAIKSLFRPLKPRWYTFGWQGVIPRNRDKMADNISRVVGQDLLGQEYLVEQVSSAGLQENLRTFIAGKMEAGLDLNLAAVFAELPASWQEQGLDHLVRRGLEFLDTWSREPPGQAVVGRLIHAVEEHLKQLELAQLVPPTQVEDLVEAVGRVLGRPETRDHLREILQEELEAYLGSERPLEAVVPAELRELLHARLRQEVPAVLARVANWLMTAENVEHISDRILLALEAYADQENLLTRMVGELGLRLFREQILEVIRERIPQVAHDYLHSPVTRDKVEEQLIGSINRFLRRPLVEVAGRHRAALAEKIGFVAGTWISSPEVQGRLAELLRSRYQRSAERPLGDLLPEPFWEQIRRSLLGLARLPPERLPGWSRDLSDWLRVQLRQSRTPFREWAGMSPESEEALVRHACDRATEVLQTEVPVLLRQFDVTRIVRAKIRGFDLLTVERLVKNIISDQLSFINLVGAILGGTVGLLLPFLNAWVATMSR